LPASRHPLGRLARRTNEEGSTCLPPVIHEADSLGGPWKRVSIAGSYPRQFPGSHSSRGLMITGTKNPSPVIFENGTVLALYKNNRTIWAMRAPQARPITRGRMRPSARTSTLRRKSVRSTTRLCTCSGKTPRCGDAWQLPRAHASVGRDGAGARLQHRWRDLALGRPGLAGPGRLSRLHHDA